MNPIPPIKSSSSNKMVNFFAPDFIKKNLEIKKALETACLKVETLIEPNIKFEKGRSELELGVKHNQSQSLAQYGIFREFDYSYDMNQYLKILKNILEYPSVYFNIDNANERKNHKTLEKYSYKIEIGQKISPEGKEKYFFTIKPVNKRAETIQSNKEIDSQALFDTNQKDVYLLTRTLYEQDPTLYDPKAKKAFQDLNNILKDAGIHSEITKYGYSWRVNNISYVDQKKVQRLIVERFRGEAKMDFGEYLSHLDENGNVLPNKTPVMSLRLKNDIYPSEPRITDYEEITKILNGIEKATGVEAFHAVGTGSSVLYFYAFETENGAAQFKQEADQIFSSNKSEFVDMGSSLSVEENENMLKMAGYKKYLVTLSGSGTLPK